jgi:hypothetical protein
MVRSFLGGNLSKIGELAQVGVLHQHTRHSSIKRSLLLISFLALVTCFHPCFGQLRHTYPLIAISEISTTKSDTFRVNAKVIEVYRCPPCPKGAQCKPCIGNHITVVDPKTKDNGQLFVSTDDPEKFKIDSSYVLLVHLQNKAHREFGVNLISFKSAGK